MDLDTVHLLENLGHFGVLFDEECRLRGYSVKVELPKLWQHQSCSNSTPPKELHSTSGWGWAGSTLSRRISPWGDPQARAVWGDVVYRCQCRRCDVFGEIRKSTPGSKTDKQLFSFQDCVEAAKAYFVYLFIQPSISFCWVSSIFCIVLSPNIYNHDDNHKLDLLFQKYCHSFCERDLC